MQQAVDRTERSMTMLKVSENNNYLVYEDGTPFFYLADTAWASFGNVPIELNGRVPIADLEPGAVYLVDRPFEIV